MLLSATLSVAMNFGSKCQLLTVAITWPPKVVQPYFRQLRTGRRKYY
jgi:hypothetical protein